MTTGPGVASEPTIATLKQQLDTAISERDELQAQQVALTEVSQAINDSPGDLGRLCETIIDKALALCDAAFGILLTYDGEYATAVAMRNIPPVFFDYWKSSVRLDPTSGIAEALRDGRVKHVIDLADSDAYRRRVPHIVASVDIGGIRTVVWVPLVCDRGTIGLFSIYRKEVRPFTKRHIALVEAFAAQATIAMENARLMTETRETLEQQTATSEVLQVINSSPGDLAPVVDAMLEKAMHLCGAAYGLLSTYDGERFRQVALREAVAEQGSSRFAKYLATTSDQPGPGSASQRLLRGEHLVQVLDLADEEIYRSGDPYRRALVDIGGARTLLAVPLRKDKALLGVINIYRQEVRAFSDKQVLLLQNFAAQAVIAMENARLLTEQREALEQQTATAEILRVISQSPTDVQPVFEAVGKAAVRFCGTEDAVITLREGSEAVMVAHEGPKASGFALYRNPLDRTFVRGRAILDGRTIHVPDLLATADYPRGQKEARTLGHRAVLVAPMLRDQVAIGCITLRKPEPVAFTPRQIELLETFAAQAVIAIENVRLFTELREALERQTATAEVLQVINSSPGNLAPVFDAMLDKALQLCGAAFGILWTFDGEFVQAAAIRGASPAYAEFLTSTPHRPGVNNAHGRLLRGEEFVHIADVAAETVDRLEDPMRRATIELGGTRTLLAVPLRKGSAVLGFFVIYRREVRLFGEKQISLLQNFAAQAVIAIENARLITETREALEQQTATAEVLQVINSSPGNLGPVFDAMLERAVRLSESSFGIMNVYEDGHYKAVAVRGAPEGLIERWTAAPAPSPRNALSRIIDGEEIVHIEDLATYESYLLGDERSRALVETGGARSLLVVALRKDGVLLGTLTAYRQEVRPFTDKQMALFQSFAAQAVIAIENARLLNETQEALERQTATTEVLEVINTSPGSLTPVFDTILAKATHLCEAEFSILWLHRDGLIRVAAHLNVPPPYAEFVQRVDHRVNPTNAHGRLLRGDPVVHIPDIKADEAYVAGDPLRRALVDLGGGRALLAVPLRKEGSFLGHFVIYRKEVGPFSDKQIALLQSFAAQALIAIENARLFEELRDRQAELRVTFDNMGDGVAMFDAELRLVAWNRNFQQIIGLAEAQLAKRPSYADYLRLLAERGEFGTENVEAGLASRLENTDRELRLERTRADGTVIEVRRNAVPGGGFVLIYSDVTEQRRAETAIRVARDAAEAALERQTATADILKVIASSPTDVQPVLEAVAKAAVRFCGATDANIHMREGDEVLHAAHEGPLRASPFIRRPLDRQTGFGTAILESRTVQIPDVEALDPVQFASSRRLAAEFGFRAVLAAPLLREGTAIGAITLRRTEPGPFTQPQVELLETFAAQAVIAIENVRLFTELRDSLERLKAAQANLIQAEKMASLGQLTAGIAHEIKNPLNFVNNFSGLSVELLDELKEAAAPVLAGMNEGARAEFAETVELLTSNLHKIVEHGRRADGIVKSMLSHSRGGKGDWQESNINALVEEALNLAYHGARAQDGDFNVTLERDFAPEAKLIDVVPQDVTRVFLNLFGNGFYATRKRHLGGADAGYQPMLRVSTRDIGEAVEVTVRDNGTGIQPEVRAKLFQPFFTTKPTGEGTGLGLSISYDIVTQQHGGSIDVESESGSFTEFIVRLPRRRRAA